MKRIIPLMAMAMILAAGPALAADATAALDLNSAYVWRGITFNDGLVAQPSIDVSYKGFGINVWGSFDLSDYDGTLKKNNFSEVDLTLSYSTSFNKLDVSVGVIEYLFPGGVTGTTELFAGLGFSIIDGLSTAINVYYDVDEVQSGYSDLSLAYGFSPADRLDLEVGAKMAYAGEDFAKFYSSAATDGGFYDYGFWLGLSYGISDMWSIGGSLNYAGSMDSDVLPDADVTKGIYGHDAGFYGGVSVSCAF